MWKPALETHEEEEKPGVLQWTDNINKHSQLYITLSKPLVFDNMEF